MKKYILFITLVLITLLLTFPLKADEGFWTNLRVSGGAYYAEEEHPDIILEKEVLKYFGSEHDFKEGGARFFDYPYKNGTLRISEHQFGGCEAWFLFKNTNPNPVSVKVGFPVKIVIPVKIADWLDPSNAILKDFKARGGFSGNKISWKKFKEEFNVIGKKSVFIREFKVIQDDHPIDIDSVLVEGNLANQDTVLIKFHFLHQLNFQPDSHSKVQVTYSAFSSTMNTGAPTADYIKWHYILSTGSTWKGPIKTIYILVPVHLCPELPEAFKFLGHFNQNKIFKAENYEPTHSDEVHVRYINYSHGDSYYMQAIKAPEIPSQSFVALKNASSYLPQHTWIHSYFTGTIARADTLWKNIFYPFFFPNFYKPPESLTLAYVIENLPVTCKNIGFGPLSLFDGLTGSAWCEGVNGDGINEWVEFELNEDVLGIAVYNGFSKSPESLLWMEQDRNRVAKIKATYENNNRVKRIEIVSTDRLLKHKIELKDTPERQVFENINLPKGLYKLYISDIYKGTRWDDTCLGEIEFFSASAQTFVEQDVFLKNALITPDGTKQKILQNDTPIPSEIGQASQDNRTHFVIAWTTTENVYAQRFSDTGVALGRNFKITDDQAGVQLFYPCTAVNGNGDFVVVWRETRTELNRSDIYAQQFSNNGTARGSIFKVNDNQGNVHQSCPGIAIDESGNFVITWEDSREGHLNMNIYAQRYSSVGTASGQNFKVNDADYSRISKRLPSVSMDRHGNFVITWYYEGHKRHILAQRYSSEGTTLGANFKVNIDQKDVAISSGPAIATEGNGSFVIIWSAGSSIGEDCPDDIYGQRFWNNGTALGTNFKIASLFSAHIDLYSRHSILLGEKGQFIVAWKDNQDDHSHIYATFLKNGVDVFENKFRINDTDSKINEYCRSLATSPSIASYGAGNFLIWWEDYRNSDDDVYQKYDIYAQRYSRDGTAIGGNFRVSEQRW